MHVDPRVLQKAKINGVDNIYGQYTPRPGNRIRAGRVVDLLAGFTSPRAQPGARELLRQMGDGPWSVVANVHTNANDPTPRVTVEVRKTRYHVRLDANGCVFDITYVNAANQAVSLSGQPPYVRPGAMA